MSKDSPRTSVRRDNDLIQKGQDDLIRRGDALKAFDWGDIYGRNAQDAINAIPAVQPTVSPELLATTNEELALQLLATQGQAADSVDKLAECLERNALLEARLGKAVEALEALIQLAHDCEKELTEDLHHMDFCGESEPLTKARATLAEIKSGVATTPYGLEGE